MYYYIHSCYPYTDHDPLIIEEMPDIYFTANSKEFETRLLCDENTKKNVRVVSVPAFSKTRSFVLVNLKNLDCFEVGLENMMVH